jgi:hypothetical protein
MHFITYDWKVKRDILQGMAEDFILYYLFVITKARGGITFSILWKFPTGDIPTVSIGVDRRNYRWVKSLVISKYCTKYKHVRVIFYPNNINTVTTPGGTMMRWDSFSSTLVRNLSIFFAVDFFG